MKRFHVHVAVADLSASVRFYTGIFGTAPSVLKSDYAKWLLEDPRINFAISERGHALGIDHLGFQVESDGELKAMRERLETAEADFVEEAGTSCCYARSDKYWTTDPSGMAWETFHTLGSVPVFGADTRPAAAKSPGSAPADPRAAPAMASGGPATKQACC